MRSWQLAWLLAQRFRRARTGAGFLSFISASSTVGIGLGCAALIAGLSVMNGFQTVLETRFLKVTPHIELVAVDGQISAWQENLARLQAQPQVRSAHAVIQTQAMVQQGTQFTGLQLFGVDTATAHPIADFMPSTTWQALQQPGTVVLGAGLAKQLQLRSGDKLTLLLSRDNDFRQPQRQTLTVVGQFNFGGEIDHQQAYVSLATAQQLTGLAGCVQRFHIYINDVYQAPLLAMDLANQVLSYVYIDHWISAQGHLYRDIQLVRVVMYLVLIIVLAVACFNIVSTLVMTVQDKQAQIAILKTMGMRASLIVRVFVWQGLQSGVLGTFIGALCGCALALGLPHVLGWIEQLRGETLLNGDVYFVNFVPSVLAWGDVAVVIFVALLMSMVATLYPAWRAARLDPVQGLHHH